MKSDAVDLRCSAAVFRGESVLLVHRTRDGLDDWVLPGGSPRAGESMVACARRETREETGLAVDPAQVAFVLESVGPGSKRRIVDLVFTVSGGPDGAEPRICEPGLEPHFVAFSRLPDLDLRPPLAGHLPGLPARGTRRYAPYLGNLWRPRAAREIG